MSGSIFVVEPGARIQGSCIVPGDKSISHRAVILGSLARGVTRISGFLAGLDCMATVGAFRMMGVEIEEDEQGNLLIYGMGMHGLSEPSSPIDLQNSGTSMRLLAGLLSAQAFDSVLTGDNSLLKRPMDRIIAPLKLMGAKIEGKDDAYAPLVIKGGQQLHGITYRPQVASAQLKSCLLLAGLYASGETKILEIAVTRDHTERLLTNFGFPITKADRSISVFGGGVLNAVDVNIPGDLSSAAFLIVAVLLTEGSSLIIKNVGVNPTRAGVLTILKMMGAQINVENKRLLGDELVADIHVKSSELEGIDIPQDLVSLSIDEFPIIFVAAAAAKGQTVIKGVKELRVKESDRLLNMTDGLMRLGIQVESFEDGAIIHGGLFEGGTVDSYHDHRISMAFVVAGLIANSTVTVLNCTNVLTSFPNFVPLFQELGVSISEK